MRTTYLAMHCDYFFNESIYTFLTVDCAQHLMCADNYSAIFCLLPILILLLQKKQKQKKNPEPPQSYLHQIKMHSRHVVITVLSRYFDVIHR